MAPFESSEGADDDVPITSSGGYPSGNFEYNYSFAASSPQLGRNVEASRAVDNTDLTSDHMQYIPASPMDPLTSDSNASKIDNSEEFNTADLSSSMSPNHFEKHPSQSRYISGTLGETEVLDSSYKKRKHDYLKFFQPGRVFCMLWTDAYSGIATAGENEQFMSNISGHRKGGINLAEHGLIYSGEREPKAVHGIDKKPLRVKLSKGATNLASTSYINYARLYTIEANVKVKDVGELDTRSLRYLKKYYNMIHHAPEDDSTRFTIHGRGVDYVGFDAGIENTGVSFSYISQSGSASTYQQTGPSNQGVFYPGLDYDPSLDPLNELQTTQDAGPSQFYSVQKRPISRSSSVASIQSMDFSSFSASSSSSVAIGYSISETALQIVSPKKFENNLRRCLLQFAAHLKEETTGFPSSQSKLLRQSAKAVQSLARNAAHLIRNVVASQSKNSVVDEMRDLENDELDEDHLSGLQLDGSISDDEADTGGDNTNIEGILASSVAFNLLKENLQLFVYPDQVKRALFDIWPVVQPRTSALEINYNVSWEVPMFLKTQFSTDQKLGGVLAVTGEAFNAQALSCRDYLLANYPEVATVQDSNTKIVLTGEGYSNTQKITKLSLVAIATHYIQERIASALAWVCAAIRVSPHASVVSSSIFVTATPWGKKAVCLYPNKLELLPLGKACWHHLLHHTVIATGFPFRRREEGRGLEISFADMALLSHGLSFIEYDGGLVVEGLRSILIPTENLPKDKAIQWHFEEKNRHKSRRKDRVSDLLKPERISKRHREQDPQRLIEARCFLGWTDEAAINIGSEDYNSNANISQSGVPSCRKTRSIKQYSFTVGTSGLGFVTAEGQATMTKISMPSRATFSNDRDIDDTLADYTDDAILVYDVGTKTAWFLPVPNVVLYMAHIIISRRDYELMAGGNIVHLQYTSPSAKSPHEALSILNRSLDFKVLKPHSNIDTVLPTLSSTVKKIWHLLETVGNVLDEAEDKFQVIGNVAPKYLHGVEFADVLKMRESTRIKEVLVNQPWAHFATYQSPVLFCKGLGQPISPVRPETLCKDWQAVPSGRNCLVATGLTLNSLLDGYDEGEDGSRLGERIEWVTQTPMVQSHSQGQRNSVFHEHELRSVDESKLDKKIRKSIQIHGSSTFVFVCHGKRSLCSKDVNYPKTVDLPKAICKLELSVKPPPNVPEPVSDSSDNTEINSSIELGGHSSMSSQEYSTGMAQSDASSQELKGSKFAQPWKILNNNDSSHCILQQPFSAPYPSDNTLASIPKLLRKKTKMAELKRDLGPGHCPNREYHYNSHSAASALVATSEHIEREMERDTGGDRREIDRDRLNNPKYRR